MGVSKVQVVRGGATETLVDLTATTVDAAHLSQGFTAIGADGELVTGSMSAQQVLCGTTSPTSSIGSDGDLYLVLGGGGSVEAYPADYTASGLSNSSNASAAIGKSAADGRSTSNVYSSSSGSTGIIEYSFDLSGIPLQATIDSVSCVVRAHEENASRSKFTLQLYAGSTAKGSETTVSGTSNTNYTLTTGTWTRAELDSLVLHTEYGYYGGLVAGCTLTVEYSAEPQASATLTVTEDGWTLTGDLWQKSDGSWSQASTATLDDAVARG